MSILDPQPDIRGSRYGCGPLFGGSGPSRVVLAFRDPVSSLLEGLHFCVPYGGQGDSHPLFQSWWSGTTGGLNLDFAFYYDPSLAFNTVRYASASLAGGGPVASAQSEVFNGVWSRNGFVLAQTTTGCSSVRVYRPPEWWNIRDVWPNAVACVPL